VTAIQLLQPVRTHAEMYCYVMDRQVQSECNLDSYFTAVSYKDEKWQDIVKAAACGSEKQLVVTEDVNTKFKLLELQHLDDNLTLSVEMKSVKGERNVQLVLQGNEITTQRMEIKLPEGKEVVRKVVVKRKPGTAPCEFIRFLVMESGKVLDEGKLRFLISDYAANLRKISRPMTIGVISLHPQHKELFNALHTLIENSVGRSIENESNRKVSYISYQKTTIQDYQVSPLIKMKCYHCMDQEDDNIPRIINESDMVIIHPSVYGYQDMTECIRNKATLNCAAIPDGIIMRDDKLMEAVTIPDLSQYTEAGESEFNSDVKLLYIMDYVTNLVTYERRRKMVDKIFIFSYVAFIVLFFATVQFVLK